MQSLPMLPNSFEHATLETLIQDVYRHCATKLQAAYAKRNNLNPTDLLNALQISASDYLLQQQKQFTELTSLEQQHLYQTLVKNALAYLNQPLIAKIAQKFASNHQTAYEDLLGTAALGFAKALNSYDPQKGFQFSTYAWTCMLNELRQASNKEARHTTTPDHQEPVIVHVAGVVVGIEEVKYKKNIEGVDHVYNVTIRERHHTYTHDRYYPYVYHLHYQVGDSLEKGAILGERLENGQYIESLDTVTGYDKDGKAYDQANYIPSTASLTQGSYNTDTEELIAQKDNLDLIKKIITKLTPEEQYILYSRYPFLDESGRTPKQTQSQIARQMHMTQPNISKREKKAFAKIRLALKLMYQQNPVNENVDMHDISQDFVT